MTEMTAWGHILLAEDNPTNQRVTRAMLENLGFHVDVVDDGAEAVSAASVTPYRAILMDCQLPILDGYLATSEIRRWHGASRRTPIIAVTASPPETDEKRCRAAGMDDYVTKPLTLQVLTDVLTRWAPDELEPSVVAELAVTPPRPTVIALEPPAPVDDVPVLDAATVERLERLGASIGEDLMSQLTVLFLADADLHIVVMREAIAAGDVATVLRTAHTFTGACGNLGALHLARLCQAFSVEGTAGDPVVAGALLIAIEAELGRVRIALDARTLTP